MPFFLKRTKNQADTVIDRAELRDVQYFVDAINLMDEREIIGRFTQFFYHMEKTKKGYTFKPNINQQEVSDFLAEHMNKDSIALLVSAFDRVDELTQGKQNYSTTIKRDLIGLVLGIQDTHAYNKSASNNMNHPR